MKICVECVWFERNRYKDDTCGRPQPPKFDRVNGTMPVWYSMPAHSERSGIRRFFGQDVCGPDARYWEPKP